MNLKTKVMTWTRLLTTMLMCIFSITQIYTQTLANPADIMPNREMRGIWVAVVNNIDWPSSPGLSVESIEREARTIVTRAKQMGLNTIFLQVRPSSDVIYPSKYEPLTSYLIGSNNNLPEDFDALQYWIDITHQNGLELHAWINPFRVTPKPDFPTADNHISKTHEEWTITYADKQYLNPGLPEARAYILDIISEIVEKYDIDGIHFDDYFYPYPVKGELFDDAKSFAENNPMQLSLADWRRKNVSTVIDSVSSVIKSIRPYVKFGVSPFGVWRNKSDDDRGSDTRAGITDYDILYADILDWADNGWLDYVAPQIYWESGNKAADFDKLAEWWANACNGKAHVYIGHAVFKINAYGKPWENKNEMPSQITKVRQHNDLSGSIFFSYRQFNRNILGLEDVLREEIYPQPSLTPQLSYASNDSRAVIKDIKRDDQILKWNVETPNGEQPRFYIILRHRKGHHNEQQIIDIIGTTQYQLPSTNEKRQKYVFNIMPVDKWGNIYEQSEPIVVKY